MSALQQVQTAGAVTSAEHVSAADSTQDADHTSSNAQEMYGSALAHARKREYDAAVTSFEDMLVRYPSHGKAWISYAQVTICDRPSCLKAALTAVCLQTCHFSQDWELLMRYVDMQRAAPCDGAMLVVERETSLTGVCAGAMLPSHDRIGGSGAWSYVRFQ